MGKHSHGHLRLHARVEVCSVCKLARALIAVGQWILLSTFSTLDLREQGHKSYVASYQANEELVIP